MWSHVSPSSGHNNSVKRLAVGLMAWFFIAPPAIHGQEQVQRSSLVKLRLTIDKIEKKQKYVEVGEEIKGRVDLLDTDNNKVDAPKDLPIMLSVKSLYGETIQALEVTIKAGHHHEEFKLAGVNRPGVVNIQVTNDELQPDGTFLEVRTKAKTSASPKQTAPKSQRSKAAPKRHAYGAPSAQSAQLLPVMFMQPPSQDAGQDNLQLQLAVPDKTYFADGKSTALVFVILAQPAQATLKINLFTTLEKEREKHVVIEKDGRSGFISLTTTEPGTVTVSFAGSEPSAGLNCSHALEIEFNRPITGYKFTVSPARIPFIDEANLVVTLIYNDTDDETKDRVVATDKDRRVSFQLDSDVGKLSADSIVIQAGQYEARTTFIPVKKGEATITAAMPNFISKKQTLQVDTPVLILMLSAFGGLLGGLIAFWVGDKAKWWRIVVGLVTGFVLYWACIFISLSSLPRGVVLHIMTALALPILGGWMGTEVFTVVLDRLPFGKRKQGGPQSA